MAVLPGSMEIVIRDNSKQIISKAMVDIPGLTVVSSKGFGDITKCTGKEHLSGQMAENTKDSM